ncbi:hypothetical protein GCM10007854_20500 [Algimonas porphyrae]|uniref:Uncharacterized protein n=1 Tax=Algimonas porphyrae TaxID=1128113 RepID=A0ABQ5V348_9PROT|nr:hypothetical protein GCM10007854_20500 [Algimonas porphyrae]
MPDELAARAFEPSFAAKGCETVVIRLRPTGHVSLLVTAPETDARAFVRCKRVFIAFFPQGTRARASCFFKKRLFRSTPRWAAGQCRVAKNAIKQAQRVFTLIGFDPGTQRLTLTA